VGIPTFKEFLNANFDWYKVDANNSTIVDQLSSYGQKDESFNDEQGELHIQKCILLVGDFGSGKSRLMDLFNQYQRLLKSPYAFKTHCIPDNIADPMKGHENPEDLLGRYKKGNWLFDELAFKDESLNKDFPNREYVNWYGNKMLIGQILIHRAYVKWQEFGWQTHFVTNRFQKELKDIYGSGAYYRLREMCNILTLTGTNRRIESPSVYFKNHFTNRTNE
jgi:energy-coupling factor transporter ATP-binding protein EcfA2